METENIVFKKDELIKMEENISEFLSKRDFSSCDTKDPVKFAKKLGFSVFLADFDEIDGIIIVNEYEKKIGKFENNKIIAVNSSASKPCKRFIIAHELAHYIQASSKETGKIVYAQRDHCPFPGTGIRDREEQKTDYMAAALLMPKEEFKKDWEILQNDYPGMNELEKIERLKEKYVVDEKAVKRRISEILMMGE